MKRSKKRKKKSRKILIAIIISILAISIILIIKFIINKKEVHLKIKYDEIYIASNTNIIKICKLITENKVDKLICEKEIARGTGVLTNNKEVSYQDNKYINIIFNNEEYYVNKDNLTNNKDKIVQEKEIYTRTTTTIINDKDDIKINGLTKKGDKLEVIGYDYLTEEGFVNKYKIKIDNKEGYVYGKYVVTNQDEALKNYNYEVYDKIHGSVKNLYNGGSAIKLDFYPNKKPNFENNKIPNNVYALYLNCNENTIKNIDKYIDFAKDTKINAFVIDIKDNQQPAYPADTFKSLSPTNYENAINTTESYKVAIEKLKNAGFYVIGRITVFKDSYYIKDNPEDAIINKNTKEPYLHYKSYWPSAYDRDVWYFNIMLAKESVEKFGFNEINFDYVRFPDKMNSVQNIIDLKNEYNEDKVEAIQRFVQYAKDSLHSINTYVSIDVFGETTNKSYTTAYGQYWPAISNEADVICGMPYPDHFEDRAYGISNPWNNPYLLMKYWGSYANDRQKEIPTPAIARTWIQAYDAMKVNGISYNAKEIEEQVKGLYDSGLSGGYITWLSNSSLEKYQKQKEAFKIDYGKEYNDETNNN